MKKISVLILLLTFLLIFEGCIIKIKEKDVSSPTSYPTMDELDAAYKNNWDLPKYSSANSAANESYLSDTEKKVFYYLNIVRINPRLFAATYVAGYKGANGYANNYSFESNRESLIADLNKLDSLSILLPSRNMYNYAQCQALAIGNKDITGREAHNRSLTGCPIPTSYGENIGFGKRNALDIVMAWLNDSGNILGADQLGHRQNCLNPAYKIMGISIEDHKSYGQCQVLDLAL